MVSYPCNFESLGGVQMKQFFRIMAIIFTIVVLVGVTYFLIKYNKEYTENHSATQVASQEIIDLINSKSNTYYSKSTSAIDLECTGA